MNRIINSDSSTGIEAIRSRARSLGGCAMADRLGSVREAVNALLTPQGREFALGTGFPSLDVWRANAPLLAGMADVLVDCGEARVSGCDFVAVGRSRVVAFFSGPGQLFHVVAMHGAQVTVMASDHAVVTVTSVDAEVDVVSDGSSSVSVERAWKGGGR